MMEQMNTIDSISLNSVFAFSLLLSVTSAIMCLRAWIRVRHLAALGRASLRLMADLKNPQDPPWLSTPWVTWCDAGEKTYRSPEGIVVTDEGDSFGIRGSNGEWARARSLPLAIVMAWIGREASDPAWPGLGLQALLDLRGLADDVILGERASWLVDSLRAQAKGEGPPWRRMPWAPCEAGSYASDDGIIVREGDGKVTICRSSGEEVLTCSWEHAILAIWMMRSSTMWRARVALWGASPPASP